MGIDYSRSVVDWQEYVKFLDHIYESKPDEGLYWELLDDFYTNHGLDHRAGTEFENTCWDGTSEGQGLADIYKDFRMKLQPEQRALWDTFFSTFMPDEFSGCGGDGKKCIDDGPIEHEEQTIAALNPISANRLFEVWKSLDLESFAACAEAAVNEGTIRLDPFFPHVKSLVLYIRTWAILVESAARNSKGIVVSIAI